MKNLRFNTKIIGVYEDKKIAVNKYKEHLEDIQLDFTDENNWYIKKYSKSLAKEQIKNVIDIYEVFNEFVDNCEEIFYVVLEKVESGLDDNNN